MSGRCFQGGKPGISPREFTAHTEMSQPFVWYGVGAQIRIGLPSNLLDQTRIYIHSSSKRYRFVWIGSAEGGDVLRHFCNFLASPSSRRVRHSHLGHLLARLMVRLWLRG